MEASDERPVMSPEVFDSLRNLVNRYYFHYKRFVELGTVDAEAYVLCEPPNFGFDVGLEELGPVIGSLKGFLWAGVAMFGVSREERQMGELYRSLEVFPDFPHSLLSLAEKSYKKGSVDEALELYRRGRLSRPDELAAVIPHFPRFDAEFFRSAIRKYPGDAFAYFDLGDALSDNFFDTLKVHEALEAYEKGLSIEPANSEALVSVVELLSRGLHRPVGEAVNRALRSDLEPEDFVTLCYLSDNVGLGRKIIDKAISDGKVEKGLAYRVLGERHHYTWTAAGPLLQASRSTAEQFYRLSSTMDPTLSPLNNLEIAGIRFQDHRYNEAIRIARSVMDGPYVGFEVSANAHHILGQCYQSIGEISKAIEEYKSSGYLFQRRTIAELYEKLGNTDEALRYYRREAYFGDTTAANAVVRLTAALRR